MSSSQVQTNPFWWHSSAGNSFRDAFSKQKTRDQANRTIYVNDEEQVQDPQKHILAYITTFSSNTMSLITNKNII